MAMQPWARPREWIGRTVGSLWDVAREVMVGVAIGALAMVAIFAVEVALGLILLGRVWASPTLLASLGHVLELAALEEFVYRVFLLTGLLAVVYGVAWLTGHASSLRWGSPRNLVNENRP